MHKNKLVANITREDVRKAYREYVRRGKYNAPCNCLMVQMIKRLFKYVYTDSCAYWGVVIGNDHVGWTINNRCNLSPATLYDDLAPSAKSADKLHKDIIAQLGTTLVEFNYPDSVEPK